MIHDTIVIGAGLAGLSAARELAPSGEDIVVLEARERPGGRVFTAAGRAGAPLELGAEWIASGSMLHALADEAGAAVRASEGEFYQWRHAQLVRREQPDGATQRLMERLGELKGDDRSLGEALAECASGEEWADARRQLLAYVEGFHAADPDRLSLRWLEQVEEHQSADASQHRATSGLSHAITRLAEEVARRCEVRYGSVVRRVEWRRGHVLVTVATGEGVDQVEARRAVITLPLAVLKLPDRSRHAVHFDPPLGTKRDAIAMMEVGDVVKVVVECREAFWTDVDALERMLFVQRADQQLPTWWVAPLPESPAIIGWLAGPRATQFTADADQLREAALGSLAAALGVPRREVESQFVACHHHDWRDDPYALGAYSYMAPGGVDAPRALRWPLEQTLYFCGEATVGKGQNATMHGAMQSGRRAAAEILETMKAMR